MDFEEDQAFALGRHLLLSLICSFVILMLVHSVTFVGTLRIKHQHAAR